MSHSYRPVGWTLAKIVYDAVLAVAVAGYLVAHTAVARMVPAADALDDQTVAIRAYGSCAFLLLSLALAIGPLARLDARFLPLLYNRRHLGVATFVVAALHARAVLDWHFAYSPTAPLLALLTSEPGFGQVPGTPFIPFGIAALLILFLLAATSHDFWLAFLTPPVWKALHMSLYAGYALVVAHVGFGALQSATEPWLALVVGASALVVVALHLLAARRAHAADAAPASPTAEPPWLVAAPVSAIANGGGIVVAVPGGEAVAIFRHRDRLSAISNLCAHQNGPLGEGCVVDGLVTCPWHGFQYRLEDGCAPAPYTERLATYRLRLEGGYVLLDPRANPPGTFVAPLVLPERGA